VRSADLIGFTAAAGLVVGPQSVRRLAASDSVFSHPGIHPKSRRLTRKYRCLGGIPCAVKLLIVKVRCRLTRKKPRVRISSSRPLNLCSSDQRLFVFLRRFRRARRLCGIRHQHLDYPGARFPLLRGNRLRVEVQRDPAVGVAEQFLGGLDIDSEKPQIRSQRVPERVPANNLIQDAGAPGGRADDLAQKCVGPDGNLPLFRKEGKIKSLCSENSVTTFHSMSAVATDGCKGTGLALALVLVAPTCPFTQARVM
jgi:hypothetical protein